MTPSKCSFITVLSEPVTRKDINNIDIYAIETESFAKFFPTKTNIKQTNEDGSDAENGLKALIFVNDKQAPTRKLLISGQRIEYNVNESISFELLRTEIENHILPTIRTANCGVWSFAFSATFHTQTIDQNCMFLPKTLEDSNAWNSSFAKVIPWNDSTTDIFLIQKDFAAQKRDQGIIFTFTFATQRKPDKVESVLTGKKGDYVLGEVFNVSYARAVEEITADFNHVRGQHGA
ncbi:hypothetical protein [Desulfovibrio sp. UCD-KL4C]|uniref:hypothetical protein n=1 Tax=Desulfovibrio sp. UCD-KL4C TaxID=2578120 RepID=UPI0025C682A5|nr:hypothetical protein [Desulfovibrio sp. UCD-KL4C]